MNRICMKTTGKKLIEDGQEDYYNGVNNSIENTMWLLVWVTGDHKYLISDEEIEQIADEELDMDGIVNPYLYEYYILHKAKKYGRKLVDRRNKTEVELIQNVCQIAHNLYTIGVENPKMEV